MNWWDGVRNEDMCGDLALVAEQCGRDVAELLVKRLGGINIYVPKPEQVQSAAKARYVLERFNGTNHKALARETGCSLRWVYKVLKSRGCV